MAVHVNAKYSIISNNRDRYHAGVKKSLVLEPGTSKISIRRSVYFHPMSDGQVKKNTVPDYISLNAQHYLATGQVKI